MCSSIDLPLNVELPDLWPKSALAARCWRLGVLVFNLHSTKSNMTGL
jgi:hypothetical protein